MGFSLASRLRNAAKTSEIEAQRAQLEQEFEEFQAFKKSQELKNFLELESYVKSDKFTLKRKEIESKKYKGSPAWKKEKYFLRLKKSRAIQNYFRIENSPELSTFKKTEKSELLAHFRNLQQQVKASGFVREEHSEEWKEFKKLCKSQAVRDYNSFRNNYRYRTYQSVAASADLQKYFELETYLNSKKFKKEKESFLDDNSKFCSKKYKKSAAWEQEKSFLKLQKRKKIKVYFRLKDSPELNSFEKVKNSEEVIRYHELLQLAKSPGFNKKRATEEWKEYESLRKSDEIKGYFTFLKSRSYKLYQKIAKSSDLQKYYELKEYLDTEEFKEEKSYLLDKKRFEKTEEFKEFQRYLKIKTSEPFQKYFKLKNSDRFTELNRWQLTFSEDFDGQELDRQKWITRYYWGDAFLKDSYALPHEEHYFTDGKNIKIANSIACLETRREKAKGKIWDSAQGFNFKDFEYTSGLISTGKSFRQKYGKFEAKIKISNPQTVTHSFWMLSEKMLPHIDIIKTTSDNHMLSGNFWGSINKPKLSIKKIKGIDFTKDFFIYSLEWTAQKLIWRLNDKVVKIQKQGVPQEPMYVIFSSGIYSSKINGMPLGTMEIDWVRCYQIKE